MTTIADLAEAWMASVDHHTGSVGRLAFWVEHLGHLDVADVTEAHVDQALDALVRRGKLKAGRGALSNAVPTGKPLSGATVNRYIDPAHQ
jgi:hypothetical protein